MLIERQSQLETQTTFRRSFLHATILLATLAATTMVVQVPSAIAQQPDKRIAQLEAINKDLKAESMSLRNELETTHAKMAQLEQVVADLEKHFKANQERMDMELSDREEHLEQLRRELNESRDRLAMQEQRNLPERRESRNPKQTDQAERQKELQRLEQSFAQHMAELEQNHSQKMQELQRQFEQSMAGLNQIGPNGVTSLETPALHAWQFNEKTSNQKQTPESAFDPDLEQLGQDETQSQFLDPFGENQRIRAADPTQESAEQLPARRNSAPDNDLFKLATALSDARAELEISEIDLEGMASNDFPDETVIRKAQVRIASIQRKTDVLQKLAEHQLKTLELALRQESQKLSHSVKLFDKGFVTESEVEDCKFRIESLNSEIQILKEIMMQ